jgi:hypothetical protein
MSGLELNVRDTLLTLVILLTLLVNLVLAVATLSKALSLYTLLVYLIVIGGMNTLVGSGLLTQEDVVEAMDTGVYPPRMRLPMRLQFAPIVALWLLWWFVSQAFFETDMVFESGLFVQLALLPVVLAAFAARSVFAAPDSVQFGTAALLAVATLISLFVPTRDWAPQYTSAVSTVVRVVLYFALVSLLDYVNPPQRYGDMVAHQSLGNRELDRLNNMFSQLESGGGAQPPVDSERMAQIRSVVAAHSCVRDETHRVITIAVLAGWLLVTPLASALLGFPVVVIATIAGKRRLRRPLKLHVPAKSHTQSAADAQQQQQQQQQASSSSTTPPATIRMITSPGTRPTVRALPARAVSQSVSMRAQSAATARSPVHTRPQSQSPQQQRAYSRPSPPTRAVSEQTSSSSAASSGDVKTQLF